MSGWAFLVAAAVHLLPRKASSAGFMGVPSAGCHELTCAHPDISSASPREGGPLMRANWEF